MNKRLRDQELSAKPRIVTDSGAYKVEYGVGPRIKVQSVPLTFEEAISFANKAAARNAEAVRDINVRRAQARHIRRAARLGLPVAA